MSRYLALRVLYPFTADASFRLCRHSFGRILSLRRFKVMRKGTEGGGGVEVKRSPSSLQEDNKVGRRPHPGQPYMQETM